MATTYTRELLSKAEVELLERLNVSEHRELFTDTLSAAERRTLRALASKGLAAELRFCFGPAEIAPVAYAITQAGQSVIEPDATTEPSGSQHAE